MLHGCVIVKLPDRHELHHYEWRENRQEQRRCSGALVTEDKEFPDGVLIVGVPAKVRRELTEEEIADMCTFPGDDYLADRSHA